ncbi:hypothetical protein V6C03_05190 [Methyloligella sp. 2.7D]|uniref:thermonuclease family protein n=1 Tax=unclassified Methyloligella TaxID=2625955 RepID=UPI00157C07E4|nr:hypothetical protein [Methyloligella sp. GL2]QKP76019.1 hypothetical protein HT051_00235 [Methyloligella sp. GL2]
MRILIALAVLLVFAPQAEAAKMLGFAVSIRDGDTFSLCEGRACKDVRLCGIRTPKEGEAGFEEARTALTTVLGGNMVKCISMGAGTPCDGLPKPKTAEPIMVQCFIGSRDIAATMVESDFACDLTGEHYAKEGAGKACAPAE